MSVLVEHHEHSPHAVPETLLELRHVHRRYNTGDASSTVLKDINLKIRAGEMIAIIGASGSGKSTLLNILGCLDRPTSGQYAINGCNVTNLHTDELSTFRRRYFGFVFQKYHLLNHLSAERNVEVPSLYTGVNRSSRKARAQYLLQRLGLHHRIGYKPMQLSGGQQQRVGIARALMNGGEVILADEPTGALDTQSGNEVIGILRTLNIQGHTIVIVTHDRGVAIHAQRIVEISDGEIIADYPNHQRPPAVIDHSTLDAQHWNPPGFIAKSWFHQYEGIKTAFICILQRPMQSFLTALGIVIGIAAVSTVVALGQGAQDRVIADINAMGANTIDIYPGTNWGDSRASAIQTLTSSDLNLLQSQSYIDAVSPLVSTKVLLRTDKTLASAQLYGVSAAYFLLRNRKMTSGIPFSPEDVLQQSQVVIIDENTKRTLFPGEENPLGKQIVLGNMLGSIIGVVDNEAGVGNTASLSVFTPYTTLASRMMGRAYFDSISLRISDGTSIAMAEKYLTHLLQLKHGVKDFFTSSTDRILKLSQKAMKTLSLLILSVAAISLLVGGIGVMNMMLVVVRERTHEIGVRMALGASQADMMWQFLSEAIAVCFLGGLIGVMLAIAIGYAIPHFIKDIPLRFSELSLLIALMTSTLIGIIFGYFPAKNAALLDPVAAMARE